MKKYNPKEFFDTKKDDYGQQEGVLSPKGTKLVSQYYEQKYQTKITFPQTAPLEVAQSFDGQYDFISDAIDRNLTLDHIKEIEQKAEGKEHRELFFFGAEDSSHSTPAVLIIENGKKGILFFDSLGSNTFNSKLSDLADKFKSEGIEIFTVGTGWQASSKGCVEGSLVLAREATGIENGNYRLPHLLEYFEAHSKNREGSELKEMTSLPPELIIVSQRSKFVNQYYDIDSSDKVIHKAETFKQFKQRYSETVNNGKEIPSYIREKGNKYGEVMEIQFYVNQLREEAGEHWTPEVEKQFIHAAKKILKSNRLNGDSKSKGSEIFDLAESYLPNASVNNLV